MRIVGNRRFVITLHFVSSIFLTSPHCFIARLKLYSTWSINFGHSFSLWDCQHFYYLEMISWTIEKHRTLIFFFIWPLCLGCQEAFCWSVETLNSTGLPTNGHPLSFIGSRESGDPTDNWPGWPLCFPQVEETVGIYFTKVIKSLSATLRCKYFLLALDSFVTWGCLPQVCAIYAINCHHQGRQSPSLLVSVGG